MKNLMLILIIGIMAISCKKEEPICEKNPNFIDMKVNEVHFACNAVELRFRNNGCHFETCKLYVDDKENPKIVVFEHTGIMNDIDHFKVNKGMYYKFECCSSGMLKKKDT